jgi:hypothetical protein
MTSYEWRCFDHFGQKMWGLLPINEPNNYSLGRIASYEYSQATKSYMASYYWPHSTGNKQGSWAQLKTRKGAQQWIERQLNGFWEPPIIKV